MDANFAEIANQDEIGGVRDVRAADIAGDIVLR